MVALGYAACLFVLMKARLMAIPTNSPLAEGVPVCMRCTRDFVNFL